VNRFSPDNDQPQDFTRLYLTGFMGAGKSTIGKILAQRIGYRFYDTDHLVMRGFRKPVSRIFQENGENAFRRAEMLVLKELAGRSQVVVSTGGGTLVRDDAFQLAQRTGALIYLRAPVSDLYERVIFSPKDRPIVDVPDTESVFLQRFEERRHYYEQADLIVDTVDRRPDDVVRDIICELALEESVR
jgi:shikimate kinase